MSLRIIDTTLRDGEQEVDISFTKSEKEKIIEALYESGIRFIEVGIPASGDGEFIKSLKNKPFTAICWCRAREDDIETALACKTGAIHISYPVSFSLMSQLGWQPFQVLEKMEAHIRKFKSSTEFFSVGAMDAFRADPLFLKQFAESASRFGADNIRIADTVGLATPQQVESLFSLLGSVRHKLEFHGHNDLGMANANTYTSVLNGAGGFSGTLCGIGERAGNAALEEVSLALYLKTGNTYISDINLEKMTLAAKLVFNYARQSVPPRKPMMGEHVFCHESGIHVRGLIKDPDSFQAYSPELVGGELSFRLGKTSGTGAVELALNRAGIILSKDEIPNLLKKIRAKALEEKRSFLLEEIGTII